MKGRKSIICARAKELQYKRGIDAITEYCKHYDTVLDMNTNNHELSERKGGGLALALQCRDLNESMCRMRVLKLFEDVEKRYKWKGAEALTITIRTSKAQGGVVRLLQKDLYPPVGVRIEVRGGEIGDP